MPIWVLAARMGCCLLCVSLALILSACVEDEPPVADASADAAYDAASDGGGQIVLAGVARRAAGVTLVGDGIGTLCATVVSQCPTPDELSIAPVLGGLSVGHADLGEETSSVDFRFEIDPSDLPAGTYALFGVLRESGGSCDDDPAPGDLASVMLLGGASCPELVVTGSIELSGLELYLNWVVP